MSELKSSNNTVKLNQNVFNDFSMILLGQNISIRMARGVLIESLYCLPPIFGRDEGSCNKFCQKSVLVSVILHYKSFSMIPNSMEWYRIPQSTTEPVTEICTVIHLKFCWWTESQNIDAAFIFEQLRLDWARFSYTANEVARSAAKWAVFQILSIP